MAQVEAGYQKDVAIWKRIEGIVRHYHVPNSDHCPYSGILHTKDDKRSEFTFINELLKDFSDGEHLMITIESCGTHKNAQGYIWMLTKPHTYERIPTTCKDCEIYNSCALKTPKEPEIPVHAHAAYFGSELDCPLCNPICHDKHKYGDENRLAWCGNPKCPMNPEGKQK